MNLCTLTPPDKTCCFTGHRSIPSDDIQKLHLRLAAEVDGLYGTGVNNFRCGGALGFDTLAALAILRKKSEGCSDVRLILVLPCYDQADRWSPADRRVYHRIRDCADEVVYSAAQYTKENMLLRDRALVDGCGICVAYLNSTTGGTAYTANYAVKSGLRVINLGSRELPQRI